MAVLDALFLVCSAILVPQALVLVLNLVSFPVLGAGTRRRPGVSILVPARNEAHNLPETLPRLLAQGADEVVVLDDASDDGTLQILQVLARVHPELKIVRGEPLPEGWTGKNWACHQLASAAGGDLRVFTDADVWWEDRALDALLDLWRTADAGLVTVWPRQDAPTWFERVVVPAVDLVLLTGLPHPAVGRTRTPALAAASGQVIGFTRDGYRRSGGHAGVRGEVLEDVRLAQRAKAEGVRLALALGGDRIHVRMYRSAAEVVEGFAKNLPAAAGGRMELLWGWVVLNTVGYALVWPLAFLEPRWLALGILGIAMRAAVARKTGRPWADGLLQPLLPLGLWTIAIRASAWRGRWIWKGRRWT